MQFKNTKKDTSKKEAPKEHKDSLKKEEIREIVEETVEEVLKEQSPSTNKPTEESHKESPDTALDTHEEKEQEEEKESTPVVLSDTLFGDKEEESTVEETKNPDEPEEENPEGLPKEKSEDESTEKEEPLGTPESPVTPVVGVSPVLATGPAPESQESNSEETPKKPSMVKLFIIFMLLGIAVGGAIWYAAFHNMLALKIPPIPGIYSPVTPTPTRAPSLTLSPTPQQVNVSVAKYDVSILNGSGIAGAASKAKATLADAGFTVTNTGNASTSDFTETVIAAKSSVDSVTLAKLSQVLGKNYTVSSHILSLNDSQTADIIVTLGSSTK